ncbi:MAG: hypothetical protein CMH55_09675 [Myxococcales bacterium]|nr:hypothetical protein [Myxococcales bacterium]
MSRQNPLGWDDLETGSSLSPGLHLGPISRTDIVRYQGASGDFQPIHHDEPFAKEAGYEAPLVVGMYPAGALATWAAARIGPHRVRSFRCRFEQMVWPGDSLTGSGVIAELDEEQRLVTVELALLNQENQVVLTASLTADFTEPA